MTLADLYKATRTTVALRRLLRASGLYTPAVENRIERMRAGKPHTELTADECEVLRAVMDDALNPLGYHYTKIKELR